MPRSTSVSGRPATQPGCCTTAPTSVLMSSSTTVLPASHCMSLACATRGASSVRCDGRAPAVNGALLVDASAASSNATQFHCVLVADTCNRADVTVAPAGMFTPVKRSPR